MSDFQLTTPVVFIIFNRPDKTREVFDAIARARPSKLLIIGDGPRLNKVGEAERVAQSRQIVSAIDWPCEVQTNYSDHNLGCRDRIATGLDWAFREVPDAIILEDDCLPHPTFFQYCQELLEHYRYDQRVGMISGDNFQKSFRPNSESYYFSNCFHIWGWATWRDRWQSSYDVTMKSWPKFKSEHRLSEFWDHPQQQKSMFSAFESVYRGDVDAWDYQWVFANISNGRVSIMPNINLISNIGFGPDASHTFEINAYANLPVEPMAFPLRHPDRVLANRSLDQRSFRLFEGGRLINRLQRGIRKLVRLVA